MRRIRMRFAGKISGTIYNETRPDQHVTLGKGVFDCTLVRRNLIAHLNDKSHVFIHEWREHYYRGVISFVKDKCCFPVDSTPTKEKVR